MALVEARPYPNFRLDDKPDIAQRKPDLRTTILSRIVLLHGEIHRCRLRMAPEVGPCLHHLVALILNVWSGCTRNRADLLPRG